ncbi:hypothetical protein GCM10011487_42400 [Steroidobacter agaridevorans]|uniref:Uncharacterized protein n=1 Tax=Steroidobacter agaridevorans TaxID=2695856 RepID=A0A829YG94_9GAMM|nr:hypothetical protein [Steroidobacter agaridevorans]GFE82240.1 hypothetical protein GCM10011487_42400 [Steroidobacter agaridevorans]GFE85372.1 hypothetical protein GCM10011488_03260 [Steroidobacter agaridevorans]
MTGLKTTILGLAMFAAVSPVSSNATFLFKEGLIEALQVDSHERAGTPDVAWIRLGGSWGDVNCSDDWGWFNAKSSPQLLALAITSRTTGTPVKVYVDDSMPKAQGFCQITVITL